VIWNPWRRARELQAQLDRANRNIGHLDRALRDSADRYDKIRDMNAHLREALRLHRNDVIPAPVLMDYIDGENGHPS
jgi:septal ring factor EnvC (AmiA/AmiB activator)